MGEFHASLGTLAGHQFTALSAHQALKDMNIVLLLLAGAGDRDRAARARGRWFSSASAPDGHRAPLALLGVLAAVCVLYRMVDPPTPAGDFLALSLREGAWLALLGSAAMIAGAVWPERPGGATVGCQAGERPVWALRLDSIGLSVCSASGACAPALARSARASAILNVISQKPIGIHRECGFPTPTSRDG